MKLLDFGIWLKANTTRFELAQALEEVSAIYQEHSGRAMDLKDQIRQLLILVQTELQVAVDAGDRLSGVAAALLPWFQDEDLPPDLVLWISMDLKHEPIGPGRPLRTMLRIVDTVLHAVWLELARTALNHQEPSPTDTPQHGGRP